LSGERFLVAWCQDKSPQRDEKFFIEERSFQCQNKLADFETVWHNPEPNFELNFMADVANKYPENITGKYYVDNQCIDCDLCRETAPDNYKRNDDGGYSFVYKQPTTPEEEARCKEAKEGCPVEAIGDNGG
jgi:ferredoxin